MKRVECDQCENFIMPIMVDENNLFSKIKVNAKCKLGKRVILQRPKTTDYFDIGGYFRYCNEFLTQTR